MLVPSETKPLSCINSRADDRVEGQSRGPTGMALHVGTPEDPPRTDPLLVDRGDMSLRALARAQNIKGCN